MEKREEETENLLGSKEDVVETKHVNIINNQLIQTNTLDTTDTIFLLV